jgi:adenylate cyclase
LSEERVERRLTAILAADVVGYSRLMGADEEGTLAALKAIRRELVDPRIVEHRGRIVKTTGDGLLVEFASVVGAVRCAVDVQREMAARNADVPTETRIEFRVGINSGDVIIDGDDIYGDGVNIAARLEALAEPGGICISAIVHDQVVGRIDCGFDDIGEQQLKNIARLARVYRVVGPQPSRPLAGGTPAGQSKTALALPDKASIAVLPFANLSGDPEQEYFADGMVEEITTALSKFRSFFVIARNSAFTYKGRAVDMKQIGRELAVQYLVEGSVRKAGSRIRVVAQLIEAAGGNHVWAEHYDREIIDIFAVQDEITASIVSAIEPRLYANEDARIQRKPPESLEAWECFIHALMLSSQATLPAFTAAAALCRRAIAIAPQYAQPHGLLAWILIRAGSGTGGWAAALAEAAEEAHIAVSLDEQEPWAHLANGFVQFRSRSYHASERAFRRALALNPNFAISHAGISLVLALLGEAEAGIGHVEQALRLGPGDQFLSFFATLNLTMLQFVSARYADAALAARKLTEARPEFPDGHRWLAAAEAMKGAVAAATAAMAAHRRLLPGYTIARAIENLPLDGEAAERFIEGLRRAGVPP